MKRWIVEGRCKPDLFVPASLSQWRRFSWGHASREFARVAAASLSSSFNGSVRPCGPVWEFRVR